MFYQRLLKLGKYHFCIMSERTLCYRTDKFKQNALSPENGKREGWSAEMFVCVGWYVKWNSPWRYTTLPSYNFTEWMISMIVTVCLWRHSKYSTNQTWSIHSLVGIHVLSNACHTFNSLFKIENVLAKKKGKWSFFLNLRTKEILTGCKKHNCD
jgi:hypothetical protein